MQDSMQDAMQNDLENKKEIELHYMKWKCKFKLKWELDGGARYNLGLSRGMGLARQGERYTHIYTHFYFPPKRKSSPTPFLQNCPARTSMKEKFITPVLELQKSPNLYQSFLISWARYVQNFMAIRLV